MAQSQFCRLLTIGFDHTLCDDIMHFVNLKRRGINFEQPGTGLGKNQNDWFEREFYISECINYASHKRVHLKTIIKQFISVHSNPRNRFLLNDKWQHKLTKEELDEFLEKNFCDNLNDISDWFETQLNVAHMTNCYKLDTEISNNADDLEKLDKFTDHYGVQPSSDNFGRHWLRNVLMNFDLIAPYCKTLETGFTLEAAKKQFGPFKALRSFAPNSIQYTKRLQRMYKHDKSKCREKIESVQNIISRAKSFIKPYVDECQSRIVLPMAHWGSLFVFLFGYDLHETYDRGESERQFIKHEIAAIAPVWRCFMQLVCGLFNKHPRSDKRVDTLYLPHCEELLQMVRKVQDKRKKGKRSDATNGKDLSVHSVRKFIRLSLKQLPFVTSLQIMRELRCFVDYIDAYNNFTKQRCTIISEIELLEKHYECSVLDDWLWDIECQWINVLECMYFIIFLFFSLNCGSGISTVFRASTEFCYDYVIVAVFHAGTEFSWFRYCYIFPCQH